MSFEVTDLKVETIPAQVKMPGLKELVKQVENEVAKNEEFLVVPETYAAAKKLRADLNKGAEKIKRTRIDTEKILLGDWPEQAELMKYAEKLEKGFSKKLGDQINAVDEAKRQKKLEMVNHEIQVIADEVGVTAEKIELDEHWLNKTYQWPKMQEEIRVQAEAIRTQMELLAAREQQLIDYAKRVEVEPDGFIAMLHKGISFTEVKDNMDVAVETRRLRQEAQKEAQEAAKRKHDEEVANAKKVGDKLINEETGEVIKPLEPAKKNFLFKLRMTDEEAIRMIEYLKKFNMYVAHKEV
ncbi:DUF1351 domain-containing protein [Pediococcus pentosaceus]|uniref:DUF1351 domain-containing protein n=1 Tax=Pediococcus pentosaceus TaxID=1255 RepID=UPI003982A831